MPSPPYLQRPVPFEGNLIRRNWLKFYDALPNRGSGVTVVQSWDVASTTGASSDWSAWTTWLAAKRDYYLIDVWCGHLKQQLIAIAQAHSPARILIEKTGPGLHLIQEFRASPVAGIPIPIRIAAEGDKLMRMEAQSARFEAGQVHLPKEAPWLAAFLHELLGFPNGRHDDQVDSVRTVILG